MVETVEERRERFNRTQRKYRAKKKLKERKPNDIREHLSEQFRKLIFELKDEELENNTLYRKISELMGKI
jgi:hypothetical protein